MATASLAQRTGETAHRRFGSDVTTQGVRVHVTPAFLPEHSSPPDRKFAFAYRIRISNESDAAVQLISRHWTIIDAFGRAEEVQGDGVIGQQPMLHAGESFEYASHCLLKTEWGTMEGSFLMARSGGEAFDAAIGRFYLVCEPTRGGIDRLPQETW